MGWNLFLIMNRPNDYLIMQIIISKIRIKGFFFCMLQYAVKFETMVHFKLVKVKCAGNKVF